MNNKSLFLALMNLFFCAAQYSDIHKAGEYCTLHHNLSEGICKLILECPVVTAALQQNGTRPTICGFEGLNSIVCCPLTKNETLIKDQVRHILERYRNVAVAKEDDRISKKIISSKFAECFEYKVCKRDISAYFSIVGGKNAKLHEFPHMAVIGWPKNDGEISWNCGGSLISEYYVLTAAHCTKIFRDTTLNSTEPTVVRLGELILTSDNDGATPQDLPIANITVHPEYAPPKKYHDIALMKLGRAATFTDGVRPVCLWDSIDFPSNMVYATGWGTVGYMEEGADVLQKVLLQLIRNSTVCQQSFKNIRGLPNGIIDQQLCAKGYDQRDTCQGDSGGPLQMQDDDYPCSYHLVGITSFGIGCGTKSIPGIYTRVSSYLDWIEPIVWPNEK